MKLRYNFSDEINEESFLEFVSFVNELTGEEFVSVYLNSGGGELDYVYPIIDIMREHNMELVCYGQVSSAALLWYLFYDGPKRVLKGTRGLTHMGDYRIHMRGDLRPTLFINGLTEQVQQAEKNLFETYIKKIIPETDWDSYRKGEDVFVSYETLKQFENLDIEEIKPKEESSTLEEKIKLVLDKCLQDKLVDKTQPFIPYIPSVPYSPTSSSVAHFYSPPYVPYCSTTLGSTTLGESLNDETNG